MQKISTFCFDVDFWHRLSGRIFRMVDWKEREKYVVFNSVSSALFSHNRVFQSLSFTRRHICKHTVCTYLSRRWAINHIYPIKPNQSVFLWPCITISFKDLSFYCWKHCLALSWNEKYHTHTFPVYSSMLSAALQEWKVLNRNKQCFFEIAIILKPIAACRIICK